MKKADERSRAISRGMKFICRNASSRSMRHGHHLLPCFPLIASTSSDSTLRTTARLFGRQLASRWQAVHLKLPTRVQPHVLFRFVVAGCVTNHFGVGNKPLKDQVRRVANRFSAEQLLGFEPNREPPPDDLTESCRCGEDNIRGRKTCRQCKRRLEMISRYRTWMRALGITFWGYRYGIVMGAKYETVLRWLPEMRPYRAKPDKTYGLFIDTVYAITHVVYTLNGYGKYVLKPAWLPQEFDFLKSNIQEAIELDNPDMVGEFLDSLKAFGLGQHHPSIQFATDYLLSKQNRDGSWGDLESENFLQRYHATWAAIDGLRDYNWQGERITFPQLQPLLKRWAKDKNN